MKPQKTDIDFYSIPIFIISYNRLDDIKKCISRLERDGYKRLIILDNASTNQALLDYLKTLKHEVHFLKKNYGHHVLWDCGLFDDLLEHNYYVLTDPDIIPLDTCPSNYVERFYTILHDFPEYTKAGFALKIDDLPDDYIYKYDMIRWESFYWENVLPYDGIIYDAPIDTTFAIYRPGNIKNKDFFKAIRTGAPYIARHLGWYETSKENQKYYNEKGNRASTSFNNKEIQKFRVGICSRLLKRQSLGLYYVIHQIGSREFFRNNVTYWSIFKAGAYMLAKKIAMDFHILK